MSADRVVTISSEAPFSADAPRSDMPLLGPFFAAWGRRHLLAALVARDIQVRHKGSVLGSLWLLGQPLVMMVTYTFVFAYLLGDRSRLGASALAIFLGVAVFQIFSDAVTRAGALLVDNRAYVKRMAFPLRAFVWVPLLSAVVTGSIALALFGVAHLALDGLPPASALLLPVACIPVLLTALGLSYALAGLAVPVRDVKVAAPFLSTVFLFLSPVLYSGSVVPEALRVPMMANPLFGSFESLRSIVFAGTLPDMATFGSALASSIAVLAAGHLLFVRLQRGFADGI